MELAAGDLITPTLRLVRPLGQGGMGHVWVADHLALRAQVVVKFMSDDLANNEEALARFQREASAASQVKSPHVVHMIDFGVARNGLPFIAMELLEGKDLSQLIARYGVLSPEGVSNIVTQVARALMRAHEKGIVHRDIKPENIFLIDAGGGEIFAKVLDFGVAKAAIADAVRTTGTGMMIGTPLYMSPEQVLGEKTIDHRTDLWSLGVVAFEAMTGGVPFSGETVGAISVAICHKPMPVPSERNPSIGPGVDAWFVKACSRDVGGRFASAKEMAEALAVAVAEDAQRAQDATVVDAPVAVDPPSVADVGRRIDQVTTQQAAPKVDAELGDTTTQKAAPKVVVPPPAPLVGKTMVEMEEVTRHWAGPYAPTPVEPRVGHVTTNGASSRSAVSPLYADTLVRRRRQRLAIVGAVGATALIGLVAIVVAVTRTPPQSEEEPRRRLAHPAQTEGASTPSATVADSAEVEVSASASSSTAPAVESPIASNVAPTVLPPVVLPSAAIKKLEPVKPVTTSSAKGKGKNVVIE